MPKPRGRPPKVIRPQLLHVSLPEDLKSRVELLLYSEVEGRVPHGAWANYLVPLIEADLGRRAELSSGRS